MSHTAVVLGAGVGGLSTASHLRELLPAGERVVLVDQDFESVQGLSLLWLLRGWRSLDDVRFTPAPTALSGIDRITGTVERLDRTTREVHTSNGPLAYDALVVALGARLDTSAVPGLDDAVTAGTAVHYYAPDAAVDAHRELRQIRSGAVVFLVAAAPYKCPAAPYEGAMLAADLLSETGARDDVTIDLYTPEPQPMPVAGPVVGQGVTSMLDAARVGFHPGHQVESVDNANRQVVFADGRRVPFDLLVFIPPHRPPAPVADARFSAAGWIPVDAHTLATEDDAVWALGDAASVTLPNGKPLPKAAVFARGQAGAVAAGVARHLGHDVPDVSFTGVGHCYVETGGHQAARGGGNFYGPDGPKITLAVPSRELHRAKEDEEAEWITRWTTGVPAPQAHP